MKYEVYFMFPGLGGKRFVPKSFSEFSNIFSEIREDGLNYVLRGFKQLTDRGTLIVQGHDEAASAIHALRKYFFYVEAYPEEYPRSIDDVSKDLFEKYYPKVLCYLRRLRTHIEREEYGRADVVAERASKEAALFELEIAEAGDRVSEYTVEQVFGDIFVSYLNMRLLGSYAKKHGLEKLVEKSHNSIGNLVKEITDAVKIIMWDMEKG